MTISGTLLPGTGAIARSAAAENELTEQAKRRLRIIDWHRSHGADEREFYQSGNTSSILPVVSFPI
jgi:hypothetical protein